MMALALLIVSVTRVLDALLQPVVVFLASAHAVKVPAFVPVGVVVEEPPVDAVYQSTVSPAATVAEADCDKPVYVTVELTAVGATGRRFTVITALPVYDVPDRFASLTAVNV
jgi:hypothetical protein